MENNNDHTPSSPIEKQDSNISALTDEGESQDDTRAHSMRKRLHFPQLKLHKEKGPDDALHHSEEHPKRAKFRNIFKHSPKHEHGDHNQQQQQQHHHLSVEHDDNDHIFRRVGSHEENTEDHSSESEGSYRRKLHFPRIKHLGGRGERHRGRNPFRKKQNSLNAQSNVLASPIAENEGSQDGTYRDETDLWEWQQNSDESNASEGTDTPSLVDEEAAAAAAARGEGGGTVVGGGRDERFQRPEHKAVETDRDSTPPALVRSRSTPGPEVIAHDDFSSVHSEGGKTPGHAESHRRILPFRQGQAVDDSSNTPSGNKHHQMKEKVTEKIHMLRRRLNPRSNKAKWRYRIDGSKEDESLQEEDWVWENDSGSDSPDHEQDVEHVAPSHSSGGSSRLSLASLKPLGRYGRVESATMHGYPEQVDGSEVVGCGVNPAPIDGFSLRGITFNNKREYRIKPHKYYKEPTYKTEKEIYVDMLQPSENVEFLESYVRPWYQRPHDSRPPTMMERSFWGSPDDGRIGSLRVEVLGCVGLAKHKPDVAVYLICGDAAFATDVIHGSRSPMWPSVSKRCAVFPLHHTFASLYVGVFDVMQRRPGENDDFRGRVVVDIPSLRPDSEYDVTLALRSSNFVYDKKPRGVIRLRFSVHWFSEQAAVLSYWKRVHNTAPLVDCSLPTIPCADPKTFRNVAITIHGQDLPGKYSRRAMQATMREFNLYQQNIRFAIKSMVEDCVLYEKPLISLYVFVTWMHCVIANSMRLVPVYFVGMLIVLLLDSYNEHVLRRSRHHGYSPVTLQEIILSLLTDSAIGTRRMSPVLVAKKAREGVEEGFTAEPLDHREFPFSEKYEYAKPPIDALLVKRSVSSKRVRKEEKHLTSRLSVYVRDEMAPAVPEAPELDQAVATDDSTTHIGEEIRIDGENEDDLNDLSFGPDDDMDSVLDDEEEETELQTNSAHVPNAELRRLPLGPPQDANVKPKKRIPPQVHFTRVENQLHKLTYAITMEKELASTLMKRQLTATEDHEEDRNTTNPPLNASLTSALRQNRKNPLDEFDKRLGMRVRTSNPIAEITSAFLGPLMRIFRIICITIRIFFNIGTWTDPYLSFWTLCALFGLMLLLIVFPWRMFFLVLGAVGFGPQNFVMRSQLLRLKPRLSNRKKQPDKFSQSSDTLESGTKSTDTLRSDDQSSTGGTYDEHTGHPKRGPRRLLKHIQSRRQQLRVRRTTESNRKIPEDDTAAIRPAFSAAAAQGRIKRTPREVVIPYTPFRIDRFYDWPPDPTVSRATPVVFENCIFQATAIGEDAEEKQKSL